MAASTFALVRALNRVDLPTLGRPTMPRVRLTGCQSRCGMLLARTAEGERADGAPTPRLR